MFHNEIVVSGFGLNQGFNEPIVIIGGKKCLILDVSDTSITCKPPSLKPGKALVKVSVPGVGETNELVFINYILQVNDFNPKKGSLLGGAVVVVYGEGFGDNKEFVTASIGGYKCHIETCENTKLTCKTSPASNVIVVDNSGQSSGKYVLFLLW